MTLATALQQGTDILTRGGIDVPRLTAEVLLAHAVQRDRVYLYAHSGRELAQLEWIHYGRYLHERLKHKPTQYITGRQEFYGRDFRVTPAVLIPRPETEHLIEAAIPLTRSLTVDVGAGSGAIGITLALETPAQVIAVDISKEALEVAHANARKLAANVTFLQSDSLTAFAPASIDLIVSNPPYVAQEDRATLQPEVRDYEPALALFAPDHGLGFYRRLIPEAARTLRPGGHLIMELGAGQSDAVRALFDADWSAIHLIPDLAKIPRVIIGTFSPARRHS